ncbi:MAG: type II secretion system F family protein [Candidatus Omnitrophica bacterium]|jgi:type IV pilus assembly protein PilC|nr:type II secretion system F family protein [Candidatus Omnitrophota bacterium]
MNFKYTAKDMNGKNISGTLEAPDRSSAIGGLRKKELIIISLSEEASHSMFSMRFGSGKKIKIDDLVIFSRQLATMVDAGIPLVGALDILSEQVENKTFAEIVVDIRNKVETGSSLSEALSAHKKVFSQLFVNMVKAGESSGMLDEILDRLALYLEKTSSLQRKVKSALVYPAVVTSMALGITLLLLLKVIPVFKGIFSGFGAQLPMPTLVLITISDALQKYFIICAGGAIAIGFLIFRFFKTEKGRLMFDSALLRLPVFGILFTKVAVSKFTRTFSTLVKSGVPILSSLEIVGKTSGNKLVERAIEEVRANVREGEGIAEPLSRSKIFPPMVTRMVSVGEQTGQLEKMLSKIADFYDEQVDASVSGLTSMMEPLIIAFLGIVIGSIVICMFLPIFKITSIVSG